MAMADKKTEKSFVFLHVRVVDMLSNKSLKGGTDKRKLVKDRLHVRMVLEMTRRIGNFLWKLSMLAVYKQFGLKYFFRSTLVSYKSGAQHDQCTIK